MSAKFYGTFEYDSPEGRDKLRELGFPTADDWVKTRILTNDELLQKAERGDNLAKAVWAERVSERIETLQGATGETAVGKIFKLYTPSEVGDLEADAIKANTTAAMLLSEQPTAFHAYLFGRTYAAMLGNDAPIAASIALARDLGDTRANAMLNGAAASQGNVPPGVAIDTYIMMRKAAGLP